MRECNCHRGPEVGKKVIGCPPKVININHPAEPVLFYRVDIPAAVGDDTTFPPTNGLYKNVLLYYEANKHTYIYSSDGIPTLIEAQVPQEVLDNIATLESNLDYEISEREDADADLQEDIDAVAQELEDLKNSPDVVDVVATYLDLQAYDTSTLTDKDVLRVLADETHDGASAYYRWDEPNSTWTFIGITGPYYTEAETDNLLAGKQNVLTAGSNIQISGDTISATDTTYTAGANVQINGTVISATDTIYTLIPATTSTLGGIKVGSGFNIAADGTLDLDLSTIDAADWSALWS